MAKAILVLDEMPDCCYNCDLRYYYDREIICIATRNILCGEWEDKDLREGLPVWCPLKEEPEVEPEYNPDIHPCYEPYDAGYIEGWNDCLKEIMED